MEKTGRPTLKSKHLEKIALNLARDGKTNKQIAEILNVGLSTFKRWLSVDKDFKDKLDKEKLNFDKENVETMLLKRCKGYIVTETKIKKDANGNILDIVETQKELPPEVSALSLYLRNRMPEIYNEKTRVELEHKDVSTTFRKSFSLRDIISKV